MPRRDSPDDDDEDNGGPSTHHQGAPGTSPKRKKARSSMAGMGVHQTAEEKQRLGQGYRDLQSQAETYKTNMKNTSALHLKAQLKESKDLFKDVKDTGIAAIDARHFSTTLDAAMGVARKMNLDSNQFNIDEILHRLRGIIGLDRVDMHDAENEDELEESAGRVREGRGRIGLLGDWEKVGWMAAPFCRRVPGLEMMYGPIEINHKKRPSAHRSGKKQLAPEKRAMEIETSSQQKNKGDETTMNVVTVFKVLRRLDPEQEGVNLFKLIINPDDFGQTVENLFYVSFLIKDGRVSVEVEENGMIMIRWQDQPDGYDSQEKRQEVLELTMDNWRDAKRIFDITKSEIPHRNYDHINQAVSAAGWYGR